jgi:hypothetical protein
VEHLDPDQKDSEDRREVDPPIEVESAMWSAGGTLDWWVKERGKWTGRVRGSDGRQSGLELLIFVRPRQIE